MNKTSTIICLVLIASMNVYAETITKTVPMTMKINRVYLSGAGELYLTQGEEEFVKLTATEDQISQVEARIKGKALYLGKSWDWNGDTWHGDAAPPRFDVQLQQIDAVRVIGSGHAYIENVVSGRLRIIQVGSGNVTAKTLQADKVNLEMAGSGEFQGDRIESTALGIELGGSGKVGIRKVETNEVKIDIGGSGDIKLPDLTAGELNTEINGSADIEVKGMVGWQELEVNGSGDYKAADLISDEAYMDIRGSGDAKINVRRKLTAELFQGANLDFLGTPELEVDISGEGKYRRMDTKPGD